MRYGIGMAVFAALVTLGVLNSPKVPSAHRDTQYRTLPDGTTLRELKPGEVAMPGWVPVNSQFGDWYDGVNWLRADGTTMTSTLVGCTLVGEGLYTSDAVYTVDESIDSVSVKLGNESEAIFGKAN